MCFSGIIHERQDSWKQIHYSLLQMDEMACSVVDVNTLNKQSHSAGSSWTLTASHQTKVACYGIWCRASGGFYETTNAMNMSFWGKISSVTLGLRYWSWGYKNRVLRRIFGHKWEEEQEAAEMWKTRNIIIHTFHKDGVQVMEGEFGGTCSTHGWD